MTVFAIPTANGCFRAEFSERGLCRLRFPCPKDTTGESSGSTPSSAVQEWAGLIQCALNAAVQGEPFATPPLDLQFGTPFQLNVWDELRRIPTGQTRSYREVAEAIEQPGAARAVGAACGANPVPVFVPCHRVLAAHHRIGGFSAGMKWKRLLLQAEGANFIG